MPLPRLPLLLLPLPTALPLSLLPRPITAATTTSNKTNTDGVVTNIIPMDAIRLFDVQVAFAVAEDFVF